MTEMRSRRGPKNLDFFSLFSVLLKLPLPGKLSILHRVSGLGLFLMLGPLLWAFQLSVTSQESFDYFKGIASCWVAKLIFAGLIWAFLHHFCAGVRFLLLDVHVGLERETARHSAAAVFAVSLIATALVCWRILL
jgi:succinate dehydrogenase / fumarate reductase cytochrome b subunit